MALIHITIEKVVIENTDTDNSQAEIKRLLHLIISKLDTMGTTLDQLLESVTKNATVGESIVTLVTGLKTRLDEVLEGTVIPPKVQTKIDAIFAATEADTQKLETAILANTPSDTPVDPE